MRLKDTEIKHAKAKEKAYKLTVTAADYIYTFHLRVANIGDLIIDTLASVKR